MSRAIAGVRADGTARIVGMGCAERSPVIALLIVAPAGAANLGMGGDLLFSVDDLVEMMGVARGQGVFNHLEALDHRPTTRAQLAARFAREGLGDRTHIPADGETLYFAPTSTNPPKLRRTELRPGLQKRLTAYLTGT